MENKYGFRDGIINLSLYNSSSPKLLWILKEVNHDGDCSNWDMSEILQDIKTDNGMEAGWENTFGPIVYVSEGIINDKNWQEIPFCRDCPDVIDILKQIAYINVKKTSGGAKTNRQDLWKAYQDNKDYLFFQINEINPDIIIYGGTFDLFANDIAEYVKNPNTKHIEAYHPAQTTISEEQYFNEILEKVNREL